MFSFDACSGSAMNAYSVVINRDRRELSREDDIDENWLTMGELAGPLHLNSVKNAEIAIKCMPERPHETNAALRAEGVKQYFWITESAKRRKKETQEVGSETTNKVGKPHKQSRKATQIN